MRLAQRAGLSFVVLGACLALGLLLIDTPVPWHVRAVGTLTVLLSLLPLLFYLSRTPAQRRPIPFVSIIGLLYSLYFGFPFAFGIPTRAANRFTLDIDSELYLPALLALGGWSILLCGYLLTRRIWRPKSWDYSRFAEPRHLVGAGLVLLFLGGGHELLTSLVDIPQMFAGLMELVRKLGWVGAGILVALWSRQELRGWQKAVTMLGVVGISLVEISTGHVAKPGRFWLLLVIAGWVGRGRTLRARWWAVGATAVILMIALRGAAGEYRSQAWYGADITVSERVSLYGSILERRVKKDGLSDYLRSSLETVESRSSYGAVLADVVRRTPESVPYWSGETYTSLVGAFVPRFLWPSKPVKDLGQRFGHRYNYLDSQDQSTSFNLPWLIEFYANYGTLGLVVGMTLLGGLLSLMQEIFNSRSLGFTGSILSLGLLVPVMTGVESDLSLVFGGLVLNGVALFSVLYLLTRRTGERLTTNRAVEVPRRATS